MIHAPHTGDVVKISAVPSNMWYVQPIKYMQLGVNPPADIASGRIAEVRSRSMSCNCMTRTSQQECRGILEKKMNNLMPVLFLKGLAFVIYKSISRHL